MTNFKQRKFFIHAILRTESPMHIAAPGEGHINMETGWVSYGSHKKNDKVNQDKGDGENGRFPATLIQRLPFSVPGKDGWEMLPVIPANNIMGHLRRHAAAILCQKFIENGESLSPAAFNVLNCGAATGKPDAAALTFEYYQANKDHLYMGLLGGGPSLMRRYVSCNNLVPKTEETSGAVEAFPHPLGIQAQVHAARKLTYGWLTNHLDDLERVAHPELSYAVIENLAQQTLERNEKIRAQRDLKKEGAKVAKKAGEKGPEKDSTRAVWGLEFVIPQVEFPVMWEINGNTTQLGLFLKMLERFVALDRIGGWARNGFGMFSLNEVTLSGDLQEEDGSEIEPIGDLIIGRTLNESHPYIARTMTAFREELDNTTAADLEALLFPKKPKQDEKEKQAA